MGERDGLGESTKADKAAALAMDGAPPGVATLARSMIAEAAKKPSAISTSAGASNKIDRFQDLKGSIKSLQTECQEARGRSRALLKQAARAKKLSLSTASGTEAEQAAATVKITEAARRAPDLVSQAKAAWTDSRGKCAEEIKKEQKLAAYPKDYVKQTKLKAREKDLKQILLVRKESQVKAEIIKKQTALPATPKQTAAQVIKRAAKIAQDAGGKANAEKVTVDADTAALKQDKKSVVALNNDAEAVGVKLAAVKTQNARLKGELKATEAKKKTASQAGATEGLVNKDQAAENIAAADAKKAVQTKGDEKSTKSRVKADEAKLVSVRAQASAAKKDIRKAESKVNKAKSKAAVAEKSKDKAEAKADTEQNKVKAAEAAAPAAAPAAKKVAKAVKNKKGVKEAKAELVSVAKAASATLKSETKAKIAAAKAAGTPAKVTEIQIRVVEEKAKETRFKTEAKLATAIATSAKDAKIGAKASKKAEKAAEKISALESQKTKALESAPADPAAAAAADPAAAQAKPDPLVTKLAGELEKEDTKAKIAMQKASKATAKAKNAKGNAEEAIEKAKSLSTKKTLLKQQIATDKAKAVSLKAEAKEASVASTTAKATLVKATSKEQKVEAKDTKTESSAEAKLAKIKVLLETNDSLMAADQTKQQQDMKLMAKDHDKASAMGQQLSKDSAVYNGDKSTAAHAALVVRQVGYKSHLRGKLKAIRKRLREKQAKLAAMTGTATSGAEDAKAAAAKKGQTEAEMTKLKAKINQDGSKVDADKVKGSADVKEDKAKQASDTAAQVGDGKQLSKTESKLTAADAVADKIKARIEKAQEKKDDAKEKVKDAKSEELKAADKVAEVKGKEVKANAKLDTAKSKEHKEAKKAGKASSK